MKEEEAKTTREVNPRNITIFFDMMRQKSKVNLLPEDRELGNPSFPNLLNHIIRCQTFFTMMSILIPITINSSSCMFSFTASYSWYLALNQRHRVLISFQERFINLLLNISRFDLEMRKLKLHCDTSLYSTSPLFDLYVASVVFSWRRKSQLMRRALKWISYSSPSILFPDPRSRRCSPMFCHPSLSFGLDILSFPSSGTETKAP